MHSLSRLRLLCLLLVVGCQPQAVDDESAAVRQIIEAYNANLVRWYEAGQMDSVASVFAAGARQMGSNTEPLVGREAIRDFWSQVAGLGTWTFEIRTEEVTAYGPVAVERGTYTLDFEPGAAALPGMAASADTGNYLVEWRLEDGRWLIVTDVAASQRSVESLCAQQQ
jgi:ketosteroid isomerase-like protein